MFTEDFREMDAFYYIIPQIESCLEDGILCGQYPIVMTSFIQMNLCTFLAGRLLCIEDSVSKVWPDAYSYYNLCEHDSVYFMSFLACIFLHSIC